MHDKEVLMTLVHIAEIVRDALLMGTGVLIACLVYCIDKLLEEYYSPENRLRRATEQWIRRQHEALEEFQNEVQKVTRR
jgi:hypothetical protein